MSINVQKSQAELYKYLEISKKSVYFNYYSNSNLLKYKESILKKAFPNIGLLDILPYLELEYKPFAVNSYIYLL